MNDGHRIMPFYMAYPLPMYYDNNDTVLRDLEYVQQLYPKEAKKYQKRIIEILDHMDYEGSMIYDEYPDRFALYKLSNDILELLKADEKKENPDADLNSEKWEWVGNLIQILLYYEIYKRRHNQKRSFLRFS